MVQGGGELSVRSPLVVKGRTTGVPVPRAPAPRFRAVGPPLPFAPAGEEDAEEREAAAEVAGLMQAGEEGGKDEEMEQAGRVEEEGEEGGAKDGEGEGGIDRETSWTFSSKNT